MILVALKAHHTQTLMSCNDILRISLQLFADSCRYSAYLLGPLD